MPSFNRNDVIPLTLDSDDSIIFTGVASFTVAPSGGTTQYGNVSGTNQPLGPYGAAVTLVFYCDTAGSYIIKNNPPSTLNDTQIANGATGVVGSKTDGSFTSPSDNDISPPNNGISAVTNGAGNLNGTYYWNTVFVLDDGTKTEPWAGNLSGVTMSNNQASLSNIPVSTSNRVVAREIYRTKSGGVDIKDYYYAFTINNNTATTATDNVADASLGSPINWLGTSRGLWEIDGAVLGRVNGQAMAIGENTKAGYASMSIGYEAGKANTTGRRNVFVGQYAGTSNTTGYQNTFKGVHAGQNNTTGWGSTFIGCYSGYSVTTQEEQVAVGNQALGNLTTIPGRRNVSIGASSMASITAGIVSCTSVGFASGKYADASYQLYLDIGIDRANATNGKNVSLIFGQGDTTANVANQYLNLNGATRLGADGLTVSALTTALPANTANRGRRATVVDASVAYTSANVGSTVAGGGSNVVPVFCNGTNWVIG